MKKELKKHLLVLASAAVTLGSLATLLTPRPIQTEGQNHLDWQGANFNLHKQIIDWNNPSNYAKTQRFQHTNQVTIEQKSDTNSNFNKQIKKDQWKEKILENLVNNKYLDHVTLNFTNQLKIQDPKTFYYYSDHPNTAADLESKVLEYADKNLNDGKLTREGKPDSSHQVTTLINKQNNQLSIERLDYPWKYDRQILGTAQGQTDGFTTEIILNRAANLPLQGQDYIISTTGEVIDQNGAISSIYSEDIKITKVAANVGDKDGTPLNNYKLVITKKVTGTLTLRLNPEANHPDMVIEIPISDHSPQPSATNTTYNANTGIWTIVVHGTNLSPNPDHYLITIENQTYTGGALSVDKLGTSVQIRFRHPIVQRPDDPEEAPALPTAPTVYLKGAWQTITGQNHTKIPAKPVGKANPDSNDSQRNPAGEGGFRFNTNLKNYIKEIGVNGEVYITLNQELSLEVKNDIFDFARYKDKGWSTASFINKDSVIATFPKLNPLFEFLTKQVAQKSRWDNEFYFGQTAMQNLQNQAQNVNILFADHAQKRQWLVDFYTDVFKKVFAANTGSSQYRIGLKNETAQELDIFEPKDWGVDIAIRQDSVYLMFWYTFFDGTRQEFSQPIRTKLFLNNLDKAADDYDKWDLRFFEKVGPIDVAKVNQLKYADGFYDLYNNIEGSQHLYNTIFQFKDQAAAADSVKIAETLFTKKQFHDNLARTNAVNIFNPRRMISFSSTDDKGNQYNSWSDLAKGKLKFNLELGGDLRQFYLENHWGFKPRYTYEFVGFLTQYDIYYNSKGQRAGQTPTNNEILVDFGNKNVNTITSDWILNNLIVYDNQSANQPQNRRISTSSDQGNNKLLATNLLKDDFVQIVLNGDTTNIKIKNRNTTFGKLDVEIHLKNIGDLPGPNKAKTLTSANKSSYHLIDSKNDLVWNFSLSGFQKNYDLQYNFANANRIDAPKLGINDPVNEIASKITNNNANAYIDKLIDFDWYDPSKRDPNFTNMLFKTRLSKTDFHQLLKPTISTDASRGQNGINEFNGIFYGTWEFTGDAQQRANAISYNNSPADPVEFAPLSTYSVPFALNNLPAKISFFINPQFHFKTEDDYHFYAIEALSQYSAKDLANPRQLIRILNELNLIAYGVSQPSGPSEALFLTNALTYADVVQGLEANTISFEGLQIGYETGQLQFDLVIDAHGGSITSNVANPTGPLTGGNNSTTTGKVHFKLVLANLKKTVADIDQDQLLTYKLDELNRITRGNYQYAAEIETDLDDILDQLLIYNDSPPDQRQLVKTILGSEERMLIVPFSRAEFYDNLNFDLGDFHSGIRIEPTDYRQIGVIITIALKTPIQVNNEITNVIRFRISELVGKANLNWTISNNQLINIREYNNSVSTSLAALDERFIWENMLRFADNPITKKYILDNSYLSLAEFKKQQQIQIHLQRDAVNQQVLVEIVTRTNEHKTQQPKGRAEYHSLNFVIGGFGNISPSPWADPLWKPIIWSAIGLASAGVVPLGWWAWKKIRNKKR